MQRWRQSFQYKSGGKHEKIQATRKRQSKKCDPWPGLYTPIDEKWTAKSETLNGRDCNCARADTKFRQKMTSCCQLWASGDQKMAHSCHRSVNCDRWLSTANCERCSKDLIANCIGSLRYQLTLIWSLYDS